MGYSVFLKNNWRLVLLFLAIVVLRLYLLSQPSLAIDMNSWKAWTSRLLELGLSKFYSPDYFSDYLPGYLYILFGLGSIFNVLFHGVPINSLQFEFLLKLFTTLFDIGSAYLIYKIVTNYQKSWAAFAALAYLINPALIFNTGIWGQVDGILAFFLLLAMYYLIEVKNAVKWAIAAVVSFIIKPQTVALLPVMSLYTLKNFTQKYVTAACLILLLLPFLVSFPFFVHNPFFGLPDVLYRAMQQYPFTSLYAFNLWAIIGWWQSDQTLWTFLPFQEIGLILFSIAMIVILGPYLYQLTLKKQMPRLYHELVYFAAALSFLAFFLFPTRMHERYLFPFFAFCIITVAILRSKVLLAIYILLSIIHFLNLWYVYFYFNYVHGSTEPTTNSLYLLTNDTYKFLSVLSIIAFGIMLVLYYRKVAQQHKR